MIQTDVPVNLYLNLDNVIIRTAQGKSGPIQRRGGCMVSLKSYMCCLELLRGLGAQAQNEIAGLRVKKY